MIKASLSSVTAIGVSCFLALLLPSSAALAAVEMQETMRDAPQFELTDTDGNVWNREQLIGKPYIVNFWATWCPPCVHELPALNSLWSKLESEGVGMLAINAGEGAEVVNEFEQKINIEFPVLLGDQDSFGVWEVRALPTTFIVNSEGKIVYSAAGDREWDDEEFRELMLALR